MLCQVQWEVVGITLVHYLETKVSSVTSCELGFRRMSAVTTYWTAPTLGAASILESKPRR